MKKCSTTLLVLIAATSIAYSQKPGKTFAKDYCEKVLSYLKTHDTINFIKLWTEDNKKMTPRQRKEFTSARIRMNFTGIWEFLDTALQRNYPIDHIEITHEDWDTSAYHVYLGTYNIKMWFRYSKNYSKGIGFHMDYINNKWMICCWDPDQSWVRKPDKKEQ